MTTSRIIIHGTPLMASGPTVTGTTPIPETIGYPFPTIDLELERLKIEVSAWPQEEEAWEKQDAPPTSVAARRGREQPRARALLGPLGIPDLQRAVAQGRSDNALEALLDTLAVPCPEAVRVVIQRRPSCPVLDEVCDRKIVYDVPVPLCVRHVAQARRAVMDKRCELYVLFDA